MEITVEQTNTGKSRVYKLPKNFKLYNDQEFKMLIAQQECIPVKAIRFLNLK